MNVVQVASPCPARWEEMEGEKVRFCRARGLNVYNLSAMVLEEAGEVICGRASAESFSEVHSATATASVRVWCVRQPKHSVNLPTGFSNQ